MSFVNDNQDVLNDMPSLLPTSCDVEDNGVERWPAGFTVYNISGNPVPIHCNSNSTGEYVDTNPYICPFPMTLVSSPARSDPPCLLKCPLPFFPDNELEKDMTFSYILAWMSLFCLLFLITSFLLNDSKRKFPQNLFLNLFGCLVVVCVMIIMGALVGREVICKNGRPSTQNNAACGLQGSLLLYFALTASCWWFCIVINLYMMVTAKAKSATISMIKYYYIFCYGFPALAMVISIGFMGFGYYAPNIICFLPTEGRGSWMQYVFYYIPIGIFMVVGAILNGLIVRKLIQSYCSVKDKVERSLSGYYKVTVFAIMFLFVWCALFTRMGVANAPIRNSFIDFFVCHVTYFSLNVNSTDICGEVPKTQPDINIMHVQYVAMSVHGILAFLLFCHDRDLYTGWIELYKKVSEKFIGTPPTTRSIEVKVEMDGVKYTTGMILTAEDQEESPSSSGGSAAAELGESSPTSSGATVE